jgi:hypothetical protein
MPSNVSVITEAPAFTEYAFQMAKLVKEITAAEAVEVTATMAATPATKQFRDVMGGSLGRKGKGRAQHHPERERVPFLSTR